MGTNAMAAQSRVSRRTSGPSHRLTVRLLRLPVSARVSLRVLLLGALAVVLVVAVAAWTMTLGEFPISLAEVFRATFGIGPVEGQHTFIVRTLRLPRVLTAALAGAALAASGAIFQGLVRNPLVAPDIIGVTAGAALVAVFMIVVTRSTALLPLGAFLGAVIAAFTVYLLTWRKGISGNRLVLVGIGLNAVCAALTTFILVRYPVEDIAPAVLWTTGTVYGASWPEVVTLAVALGILLPISFWLSRHLGVLQLGDDAARSLGVRAEPARGAVITIGAALAAVAVAASGPIGFIALIAPHIARMLAGPLTGGVLALSALIGAVMLGLADLIAQHAFPLGLPVGVVTAAVGAPYFLFLLYRTNRVI